MFAPPLEQVVSSQRLTEDQASNAYELLKMLATASPPLHALIDVGALVIGPSNREAVEFMLAVGLPEMDAAVYLDDEDREMVVFRGGGAPVPLRTTGIPWNRRLCVADSQSLDFCVARPLGCPHIVRCLLAGLMLMQRSVDRDSRRQHIV
jgi:hypothetical protein